MKITAHFHGILADWVGVQTADFDLPENAALSDLLLAIGRRYRSHMPEQLWDDKTDSFAKQVRAKGSTKVYTDVDTPLEKGEDITFMLMIAGG